MLPNLVVIGAQKCGTSALHYYLGLHPEVSMSQPKELNFFVRQRNWSRGIEWYESHFQADTKIRGESSPNYTNYPRFKGVARRMHSLIPDAKLIYLVRDPIERIVSAYLHNRVRGRVDGTLEETVADPSRSYIRRSRYYKQIRRFRRFDPALRILVLEQNDLLNDRRGTLARVFRYLEVDDSFWTPDYERLRHETASKQPRGLVTRMGQRLSPELARAVPGRVALAAPPEPVVGEDLRRELTERLKPDIDRFREFTGRDFPDWSV